MSKQSAIRVVSALVAVVVVAGVIVAVVLTSNRGGSAHTGGHDVAAGPGSTASGVEAPGSSAVASSSSALPDCVKPDPAPLPAVEGAAGGDIVDNRVVHELSLDDGTLQLTPPSSTAQVSAGAARCNLLAAYTSQNAEVFDEVDQRGFSFGLADVTVADDMLRGHSTLDAVTGTGLPKLPSIVGPYHDRLMWVAVVAPLIAVPCPAMIASGSPPPRATPEPLGYQVLAIDAGTGRSGIVYTARTTLPCGGSGLTSAYLNTLVEQVSVPWTQLTHGSDVHSVTATIRVRACDGYQDVWADRGDTVSVRVEIMWPVVDCGPASSHQIEIHSATTATVLPAMLRHGAVGAQDVEPPQ